MAILATYMTSSQFSIDGEHDQEFEAGRRIRLLQGESGNVDVTTTSAAYDSGNDRTVITVAPSNVASSLATIKRGPGGGNSSGEHGHSGRGDGGFIAAALLSSTNIAILLSLAALSPSYGEVIQGDSGGELSVGPPASISSGVAGEALTALQVVYPDTADSGKFKLAQSDGTAAEAEASALVLSASLSTDGSGYFHAHGFITDSSWSFTPGAVLWLDAAAGGITETEPVSGYGTRLGKAWTATKIFFNPLAPVAI